MTAPPALASAPAKPKSEPLQRSYLILKYAHDTAAALLKAFNDSRNGKRGTPTDEQQDLLRAMVVFAGAGLDSMTKQLVRDALPGILEHLPDRRADMERLVARHLRRASVAATDELGDDGGLNPQRLARILLADSPRVGVAEMLVSDLTAGSLQSASELFRVASFLGVEQKMLDASEKDLKAVFDCRNQIIHEMDIDFTRPNRNRFSRTRADMVKNASLLLDVAGKLLGRVDSVLAKVPARK
ncbi:MAG: hypothetical protein AMXMBFR80_09530 [Dehalococcoidia bacterium]